MNIDETKQALLAELKAVLTKYNACLSAEVGEFADTHGLYGQCLNIHIRNPKGFHDTEVLSIEGWEMSAKELPGDLSAGEPLTTESTATALDSNDIRHVIANYYLSTITSDQGIEALQKASPQLLAECLVDTVDRGQARPLFCDEDGLVDGEQPKPLESILLGYAHHPNHSPRA